MLSACQAPPAPPTSGSVKARVLYIYIFSHKSVRTLIYLYVCAIVIVRNTSHHCHIQ